MTHKTTREILDTLPNYLIIGSRGLGVATKDSDLDIAMLWKDLPKYLNDNKVKDIRNYFNYLPLGNSGLIRLEKLDILLFEEQSDLNILKQSMSDLKVVPWYLLEDKTTRIHLFEQILNHYGFRKTI